MDLTAVLKYIWNILILLSLHIPGTILNTIENNNARLKENPHVELNAKNANETIRKVTLSTSAETLIQTSKKARELSTSAATTIKPIELLSTTTSLPKNPLSSTKPDTASDIRIQEHSRYLQEYGEKDTMRTDKATLSSYTLTAKHRLESLVNEGRSRGDFNAPLSLQLINRSVSTNLVYAQTPHISTSMTPAYDVPTEFPPWNNLRPLVHSGKDRHAFKTALMKVNRTTMSNGNTKASRNQPTPHSHAKSMVIYDGYGPIGGEPGKDAATTPHATLAETSLFAVKAFNRKSPTNTSHKYNVNSELTYFPYESAAFVADAKTMYISANQSTMTAILSSPAMQDTADVKKHFTRGTAALVPEAGDEVQAHYYFKNSKSEKTSETTNVETSTSKITSYNGTVITSTFSSSAPPAAPPTTLATADSSITATSLPPPSSQKPTRRRPVVTTTLKPPPTIDDYQTITSQAGTHAYLPCNVKQLVKKPISWLRVRDGHILTVDQTTFIADQRFQSIFTVNPERWSLQIKYVQLKDAGIYECQVSTEPKASAIVYLQVVEPKTELIGAPTRHVKAGSQVKLLCIISQALEPPLFINWFYNQKQIYLHNRKGWRTEIERIELPPATTTTAKTTTTSTTTTTTTTKPASTSTSSSSGSSASLTTTMTTSGTVSPSLISGSEVPAVHVFTSIKPQSLNDGNLLDMVSESPYHTNLIQPEAVPSTPAILTTAAVAASVASTSSAAGTAITTALPTASATTAVDQIVSTTAATTTLDAEDDFTSNPVLTAARKSITATESAASAAERGYMMLSTLMTVTDVKQITTASLIIPSVQKQDSGNYTCSPSNSEPRTVILHVLNGEYSASAITSGITNVHFQHNYLTIQAFAIVITNYIVPICGIHTKGNIIRWYSGG